MDFPIRINKYLTWKKYATRKEADRMIEHRLVCLLGLQ